MAEPTECTFDAIDAFRREAMTYLAGLGLGSMMRVRDLIARGQHEAALEAAREAIAVHLRLAVKDADEAWIARMSRGPDPADRPPECPECHRPANRQDSRGWHCDRCHRLL